MANLQGSRALVTAHCRAWGGSDPPPIPGHSTWCDSSLHSMPSGPAPPCPCLGGLSLRALGSWAVCDDSCRVWAWPPRATEGHPPLSCELTRAVPGDLALLVRTENSCLETHSTCQTWPASWPYSQEQPVRPPFLENSFAEPVSWMKAQPAISCLTPLRSLLQTLSPASRPKVCWAPQTVFRYHQT